LTLQVAGGELDYNLLPVTCNLSRPQRRRKKQRALGGAATPQRFKHGALAVDVGGDDVTKSVGGAFAVAGV
jgi:hypothetical protein